MKKLHNVLGGFAGALALNILHETFKRLDHNAPHVDLVGEQALTNVAMAAGVQPPTGDKLFVSTLAADLGSNMMFYSLIGQGKEENLLLRGSIYGLALGVGTLALTKPMGLDDAPIARTTETKLMTIAWYLAGGVVAALTINALRNR